MKPIEDNAPRLMIVTGMSGAGKTLAVQSLEDLGVFCVDNLPPVLIPKFADLIEKSRGGIGHVAVVIDLRTREFFSALEASLDEVEKHYSIACEILFLDASDEMLVQRYKESRRGHPLAPDKPPLEGIQLERKLLEEIKGQAHQVIDTSRLRPAELKRMMSERFGAEDIGGTAINIVSFGFKYGIPIDADLVFDVRFLPNPHYVEALKPFTGRDPEVYDYVMKWPETEQFLKKFLDLLLFLIPQYKKEGKSQVVIGIGCTGGKHRSVALSEYIGRVLSNDELEKVRVSHRDSQRDRG